MQRGPSALRHAPRASAPSASDTGEGWPVEGSILALPEVLLGPLHPLLIFPPTGMLTPASCGGEQRSNALMLPGS